MKPHLFRLVLFAALLLSVMRVSAQSIRHDIARDYERNLDFSAAADVFTDIVEKHPDDSLAQRGAVRCLIKTGKYEAAMSRLKVICEKSWKRPQDVLLYADMLRRNRQYDEAIIQYSAYLKANPGNSVLAPYAEDPGLINRIMRDSARFKLKAAASINSTYSDFGPCVADSLTFFFSSARPEGKGKKRAYAWNDQSYLNIFSATLNPDTSLRTASVESSTINSRFHEGTLSYDKANRVMYITRNLYYGGDAKKGKDGVLRLGIFSSQYANGEWATPEPFRFNDISHSNGHPALSSDGNTLYFVSDRPGGFGGTDLWKCTRENGDWTEPVNLGPEINTAYNEMFPFVQGEYLYFASEGHPGLGGLDIFRAEFRQGALQLIRNIGYPVNTSHDDFGLVMIGSGRRGFFSSNRPGGAGDDDIYEVRISKPVSLIISGKTLFADTGQPLENVTIIHKSADGVLVEEIAGISGSDGNYSIEIPYSDEVVIRGSKEGFLPTELHLVADPFSGFIDDADLRIKSFDYIATGTVFLSESNKPANNAKVLLTDQESGKVEEVITGPDGKYSFGLMPGSQYKITASYPDYIPLSVTINTSEAPKGEIKNDFKLFKAEKGTTVRMDNIYYDYGKADIRPDAALELNKLIDILRNNPSMKIELSSHTDSRGSDSYNLDLSNRRAKSAVNYIISQGIDKSRLVSKGYGETKPLNRCANGVECSEEEFQLNRRTEFTILDI